MKKILVVLTVIALLAAFSVPVMAAGPETPPGLAKKGDAELPPGQTVRELVHERNMLAKEERMAFQKDKENGASIYDFYLSGEVMPVPPYGGSDIEGSDEASKLIVGQPEGDVAATVTGVMKGLVPMTDYTVYISNGYTSYYAEDEWSLVGEYIFHLNYNGTLYAHDIEITSQVDGVLEGTGGYPAGQDYTIEEEITGTIEGNVVTLHSLYVEGVDEGYYYDVELTIQPDGALTGTWLAEGEDLEPARKLVVEGKATQVQVGDTGYPGLLNPAMLPTFTFTTDEDGHASWHVNIMEDMIGYVDGEAEFSVWINSSTNGTVLISETVVIEE